MTTKEIDDKAKTVAEAYLNSMVTEAGILLSTAERAIVALKLQSLFLAGMQFGSSTTINLLRGGEILYGKDK